MASLFSTLAACAASWSRPQPDYPTQLAIVGAAAASDHAATSNAIVSSNAHSPTVVGFQVSADPTKIYIGYSPIRYPTDLTATTPFDDSVMVLVGDVLEDCTPVVLPAESFARTNEYGFYNKAYIKGANGYATAAVPVVQFDRQASGAVVADTDEFRVRKVMLMPHWIASKCVEEASEDGTFTLQAFEATIIEPEASSGDAGRVAMIAPVEEWWRGCSHHPDGHADQPVCGTDRVVGTTLAHERALNRRAVAVRESLLARLGIGGPQLNNAAFNAGVTSLENTLRDNHTSQINFQRAQSSKTFTQKHGAALASRVRRWCGVTTDAALPEVHKLLAMSDGKARDFGIIQAAVEQRVLAAPVPLTMANCPLVTTRLVEEVFRQYQLAHPGLRFARGLSPFAMVCDGHSEQDAVRAAVEKARLAASGNNSMSLADAEALLTTDVRFPSSGMQSTQKLYSWSLVIDVFHDKDHDIAISVRNFATQVGPALDTLCSANTENPAVGIDLTCRVLFKAQQDYFGWAMKTANGTAAIVPTFEHIIEKVLSFRASSLSTLPASWYLMIKAGAPQLKTSPAPSVREEAGAVPTHNSYADEQLMARFTASRFNNISELLEASSSEQPKHNGIPVCLTWALEGACGKRCKRKKAHVRYPSVVINKIHQLMRDAGVPSSEE